MAIEWRQDARTVVGWIDSLPTDGPERDAIIEHPDPTYLADGWGGIDHDNCGCLVGCVIMALAGGRDIYPSPADAVTLGLMGLGDASRAEAAAIAFPALAEDFSPERAWAWAKKRAARPYRTANPLPAQPAVQSTERLELTEVMGD